MRACVRACVRVCVCQFWLFIYKKIGLQNLDFLASLHSRLAIYKLIALLFCIDPPAKTCRGSFGSSPVNISIHPNCEFSKLKYIGQMSPYFSVAMPLYSSQ